MNNMKKTLFLALLICLTLGSCLTVSAAGKSSKGGLSLDKSVYTMKKGKKVKLKATAPKGSKVVWSSSNTRVASVANGVVSARKNGKATITAKLKGKGAKAVCKITVGTPVAGISLNQSVLSLEPGSTFKLSASVSPKKPSNKKVAYLSSNKSIVTVTGAGMLTAVSEGRAQVTALAADGTGKKAICDVTVAKKKIWITGVTMSESSANLEPGQTKQLSASYGPADATENKLVWSSSNPAVLSVSSTGLVKAEGEGTAAVYATAPNGIKAGCDFKVSYKGDVSNQAELDRALASKMVKKIVYRSDKTETIQIAAGNYSDKTIEIDAPNAEVNNRGRFEKVTINRIASNTYHEYGNNTIFFQAAAGRVIVEEQGIASINLSESINQTFNLENRGYVRDLFVHRQTSLRVSGRNVVPVTIGSSAAGTSIITEAELAITARVRWDMTILPGGEHTRATVDSQACMPSISGIGCIPITVSADNDVINLVAEMDGALGLSQKVAVSGNVQEYSFTPQSPASPSESGSSAIAPVNSAGASVSLVPYSRANSGMTEENCDTYLTGDSVQTAQTASDGRYSIADVIIGNYWLVVKKAGFAPVVQNIFIDSFRGQEYTNGMVYLLSSQLSNGSPSTVSGRIISGFNAQPVQAAGIRIKLRKGNGNIIGQYAASTVTDADGKFSIPDVNPGVYTIEALDLRENLPANAERYNAYSQSIVVAAPYLLSNDCSLVMNPRMQSVTGEGLVQFTLTWGNEESGASSDIDSHLVGPRNDGQGMFHVYFSRKSYSEYTGGYYDPEDDDYYDGEYVKYADLDVDDTDYEGPEHTTIYKETPGIYRFFIFNYSDSGENDMLAKSSVRVTVTIGNASYTYNCPNMIGDLWYVCDYNSITHTIIPKNIVSTHPGGSSSDIGMTQEELDARYLESEKSSAMSKAESYESYLKCFNDGAAKTAKMNAVTAWKNQIQACTSYEDASRLNAIIGTAYQTLQNETRSPSFTMAGMVEKELESGAEGGRWYREFICMMFSSGAVSAPVVEESESYTAQVIPAAADLNYAYIIRTTYQNGLVCDYRVRTIDGSDEVATRIAAAARDCRGILGMFDDCADIQASRASLQELEESASSVTTEDELDDLCDEIRAIASPYSDEFYIDDVSAEEGLDGYFSTTMDEEDDDGNWTGTKAVLKLWRYDDVTDADILEKLDVTFDTVYNNDTDKWVYVTTAVEMRPGDTEYPAVLKATNPVTGHVKNYYICIDEY